MGVIFLRYQNRCYLSKNVVIHCARLFFSIERNDVQNELYNELRISNDEAMILVVMNTFFTNCLEGSLKKSGLQQGLNP